jgi:hypothetical protein
MENVQGLRLLGGVDEMRLSKTQRYILELLAERCDRRIRITYYCDKKAAYLFNQVTAPIRVRLKTFNYLLRNSLITGDKGLSDSDIGFFMITQIGREVLKHG